MDVANASVYDAATGLGEAARMACAITRRKKVLVADTVNPLYVDVLRTYTTGPEIEVAPVSGWRREGDRLRRQESLADAVDESVACLVVQQPNFLGWLEQVDGPGRAPAGHRHRSWSSPPTRSRSACCARREPTAPAIAVAEGKWTGGPLDFGGPLVGMFACQAEYVRQMPGRIAGATVDGAGAAASSSP